MLWMVHQHCSISWFKKKKNPPLISWFWYIKRDLFLGFGIKFNKDLFPGFGTKSMTYLFPGLENQVQVAFFPGSIGLAAVWHMLLSANIMPINSVTCANKLLTQYIGPVMHLGTRSSLIHVMAGHLFSVEPLLEQMLTYIIIINWTVRK